MAQFDVHAYRGLRRADVAYVVVVQSALYDSYRRRIVVPLLKRSTLSAKTQVAGTRLNPVFRIGNQQVVLNPLETVSMDVAALGDKIASLAEHGQAIADALDEVFTRSWG